MSKIIKHEFRATARLMLPLLAAGFISAILDAVFSRISGIPEMLKSLAATVLILSVLAVGIMGIIIIIGRFYKNTMTDTAYLTMTLPVSSNELIFGELIVCLAWVVITAAVMTITMVLWLTTMDMLSLPDVADIQLVITQDGVLSGHGINSSDIAVLIAEGILALILLFAGYCLRFYAAMATSQLFTKHRVLVSVAAYILIGIVMAVIFVKLIDIAGGGIGDEMRIGAQMMAGLGVFDFVLLVTDAVLFLPTSLIIGKRINLY